MAFVQQRLPWQASCQTVLEQSRSDCGWPIGSDQLKDRIMRENLHIPAEASAAQLNLIIGALYLSLVYAVDHIVRNENESSVAAFKVQFLSALKNGDIDMSIFDDQPTFDFIVPIIEGVLDVERAQSPD